MLVPTIRTKPTFKEFGEALTLVWSTATKESAGILWAHFAIETGDGEHCYNYNLGNVKHVRGDGFDYISLKGVWEGFRIGDEDADGDIDEVDRRLLVQRLTRSGLWRLDPNEAHQFAVGRGKVSMIAEPSNPASWFRAYDSLLLGMQAFVEMKRKVGGRYHSAWQYVIDGNPDGYARELGRKGYYTASPDVYAAALRKKFVAFMLSGAWGSMTTVPAPPSTSKVVPDDEPTQPVAVPRMRTPPFGHVAIVHPPVPLGRPSLDDYDEDDF
jgi:hypothetical protein